MSAVCMGVRMMITFLPLNKKVQAEQEISLQEMAQNSGIDTGGICNGRKTCGKCKVLVSKGNDRRFLAEEEQFLTEEEKARGIRLACCFYPKEDSCVILERVNTGTTAASGKNLPVPDTLKGASYGVAMDIGTTNIEAALYDRQRKVLLQSKGLSNPQRMYGGDVVSRITFALEDDRNAQKLQKLVKDAANTLIKELAAGQGISPFQIDRVVMAGNTTMTNLLLGRSLKGLARAPFQSGTYSGIRLNPGEAGLTMHPGGHAYVLPGISGHVGGDALACILSTELYKEHKKVLLMDIGTNGELVLCDGNRLITCSAAAGPAFEGGNISCGMRAEAGAITSAEYREGQLTVHFIGEENKEASPAGICGSGLIDCICELYRNGKIDETGRLLGRAGEENLYRLWEKKGVEVSITQKDIREFQLALGAIRAGTAILLEKAGLQAENLDKIYLAGNFGGKLSVKKAIEVGLLPFVGEDRVEYIGNGVITGGAKVLLEEMSMEEAEEISQRAEHIELALQPTFEEEFIKAMSFPPREPLDFE